MGNQITLSDVVFSDSTLPVLRDDPLLSSGSLVLVDVGHSKGRLAGVPSNGALVNNIAGSIASGLVGSVSVSPDSSPSRLRLPCRLSGSANAFSNGWI